ncbi:MAG TPA: hypothetical protein PK413_18655 [Thermoanaerobaculia bacterium]|nr:hypothetical protein [Thermoanaerobaculia bacterium]
MHELTAWAAKLPFGPWVLGAAGVALLLAGRRILWLAVAVVGFGLGVSVAFRLLEGAPPLLVLVVGLGAGLVAVGLALFIQKLAVFLLAFVVGGWLATLLSASMASASTLPGGLVFAIGGVVGALAAMALFEWALATVSSVAGALLILSATQLSEGIEVLLFFFLVPLGLLVQLYGNRKQPPK